MKTIKIAILTGIFALGILSLPFTASAVVDWTKDNANNPVLQTGGTGAWDEGSIDRPAVIKDGSTYEMWYGGDDGTPKWQIGYATSTNGTTWAKYGSNPVLTPSVSGWDSTHVGLCWVIKDGATYKMWYTGTDNADEDQDCQIGYATSSNGTTWTKDAGNPVLSKGLANDWDADFTGWLTVIYDASATTPYKMWYAGYNNSGGYSGIGYATSTDGISWTKYNDPSTTTDPYANSDPVIKLGHPGSWDNESIGDPTVVKEDSIYRIWIFGQGDPGPAERIGYAYSLDGINWRKYDGNPVMFEGSSGNFDEKMVWSPMVLKDGNTYKMWYVGENNSGDNAFGYATSQAWQGTDPDIEDIMVASVFTPWGGASGSMMIMVACWPYGPGPLDVNELKVEGPGGFSYTFPDSDTMSLMGLPIVAHMEAKNPVTTGTYTFYLKANNGLNDSRTVDLTGTPFSDYLREGGGYLDRDIKVDATIYGNESYISATTPTFRWQPYVGTTGYYYRVRVTDWKNNAYWYMSSWDEGTNTSGGYMSAQPPEGILKSNTPYRWQVEVSDTNVTWAGHNRAQSTRYDFYTGTKSGTADFLNDTYSKAWFRSARSFRDGDQAHFWAFVHNLAPWDIELDPSNQFRVDIGGVTPFYDFNPANDAFTADPPIPFMYIATSQGFPDDGTYNFYVYEDLTGNNETASKGFSGVTDVPQVTKDEMRHENVITRIDNAYLPYTDPELFWKSKGTGYWHRVMVFDWQYRRLVWASDFLKDVTAGSDMSAQVPEGTLKEHTPYRWWVEVYDSTKQNRTRSQWLSFKTGAAEEPGRFLPAIYLLLLGD